MSDLINGREMLNRYQVDLCYGIACKECSMSTEEGGCRVEEWIDTFPPADRPQGEWIEHKGRTIVSDNNFIDFFPTEYECSNCGLRQSTYFINSTLPNFCPHCGAYMKGADDE